MATTALLSAKASFQGAQISTRLHNRHIICIYDLPPEILAEIFLSVEYYESPQNPHSQARRNGSCSTVLASVCKTWRSFALRLPWLWSRILIKTTGVHVSSRRSKYVRLLNERSLVVTVDLAIWVQWDKGRGLSLTNTHEAGLRQLVSTLAPLAPRTRRFELVSHVYSGPDLRPILASFIKLCTSSSLEVFTVHAVHRALENAQLFDWRHLQLTDPPTDYQINSFIQPVRVLDLQDVRISWDSSFY